uniref:PSP1 C-terminal domain-containing protein n=1 Tax=Neobodo designis TaxID=312471 RepID=A0A7S1PL78_NEODS|mmetsp:Transcript_11058/g.34220  ORF Transcript_11058/g.34220 Transcript_11058/m.34220 type:complete len:563 (+) Transcript_11058:261-1949(+)
MPPPPTQRRMLSDITRHAESEHNRDLQQQDDAARHGAMAKPIVQEEPQVHHHQQQQQMSEAAAAEAAHMSYLQRQYHSVALSDSIKAHNEYVAQQKTPATPTRTTTTAGRGPSGRANRRSPKEQQKATLPGAAGGMAPHPHHADVDGYPCPCPDCNMARLHEAMAESGPQHHDHEMAMLHQQHMMQQQGGDASADYYHGAAYHHHQQQQFQHHQQQSQQHGGGYRQHSPYAPVGYSPNQGYYGLPPSMPGSPAVAGGGAGGFDVPYIPAPRANYARFAMAPEGTPSSDGGSPTTVEPDQHQHATRTTKAPGARQAPPRAERKKDHAKLSPTTQPAAPAFPSEAETMAAEQPATPAGKKGKGARKGSPTQDGATGRRSVSPISLPAPAPRPPCPHALMVRCSPWHVRPVLSPFAVKVGEVVVFEGDRGQDAGVVVEIAANEADPNGAGRQTAMALALGGEEDIKKVNEQEDDAAATVDTAKALVEKLGLRMTVVGAVFQHDRMKLTFMYEAAERVDFRQLLRELYSEFRCRIWLEVPPGAHNPATSSRAAAKSGARSPNPQAE